MPLLDPLWCCAHRLPRKAPSRPFRHPARVLCLEHDPALLDSTRGGLRSVLSALPRACESSTMVQWPSFLPFAASGLPACASARSEWHHTRSVQPRALPCVKFSSSGSVSASHPWPCRVGACCRLTMTDRWRETLIFTNGTVVANDPAVLVTCRDAFSSYIPREYICTSDVPVLAFLHTRNAVQTAPALWAASAAPT